MAQSDRKNEESFYIKGDAEDPTAYRRGRMVDPGTDAYGGKVGHTSDLDLTAGAKKIIVEYRGKYGKYDLQTDVYQSTPGTYEVHIYCPKCHEVARITSERKAIEFDPERRLLSVEKFGCTWEIPEGRKMEFGLGLCRAVYAIDRNVLKDA